MYGAAPIAWAKRVWALPFLTVLCPLRASMPSGGRRHHTVLERAWQSIRLVRRWLPDRELVFVADSSFAALEWLALVARLPRVSVITRLRLMPSAIPRRRVHQDSAVAPASKGNAADPGDGLADRKMQWSTLTVEDEEGPREVEVTTTRRSGITRANCRWPSGLDS